MNLQQAADYCMAKLDDSGIPAEYSIDHENGLVSISVGDDVFPVTRSRCFSDVDLSLGFAIRSYKGVRL